MDLNDYFKKAIYESKKCISEDSRIHPKVGVVIIRGEEVIATAFRGEENPGDHAEQIALDKKLNGEDLTNCWLFTTLEPCTKRSSEEIPCAQRIIDRGISKVFIGMTDPNKEIDGKGVSLLTNNNVSVEFFPKEYALAIRSMNSEFRQAKRNLDIKAEPVSEEFIEENCKRRLDEWYATINQIYWNSNYFQNPYMIFTHLVEVVGGLSIIASNKVKDRVIPEEYIVKAIAWWMTLCGKLGVKSVETMVWYKFPEVCAYCRQKKHDNDTCLEEKAKYPGPLWGKLAEIGQKNVMPNSLFGWQRMFAIIYPIEQSTGEGIIFARLAEELGEIAESIRVFNSEPGYFLSEASDLFAWIMQIANLWERKNSIARNERGIFLARLFTKTFADRCPYCGKSLCICPPILPSTIGRTTHEVPKVRSTFEEQGDFLTPPKIREKFCN